MRPVATRSATSRLTEMWPVRLSIYLGALVLVVIATKVLTTPLVPAAPSPLHETIATVRNILQAIVMLAVYSLLVRWMEHRPASEIFTRPAAAFLLSGIVIGSGLIALAYAILFGLGVARFSAGTGLTGLTVAVLMPAVVGILEELVFRVILFRILQRIGGTFAAVFVSAILFGLAHAGNPGATPLAMACLTVELGVFLALIFTLTESLWMVAGVHMSWNFAQGFVFGSDVSGLQSSTGIMRTSLDGPDWLTGGAFGLEGSIITLGVSVMSILIAALLIARRRLWQGRKFEVRAK